MLKNIKFLMATIMLFSMGLTSCIEEGKDEIAGKGTNEFRFEGEDFGVVTFLPNTADQTKALITIYRDGVSTSAMDKEVTVSLEINADSLAAYNTEHGTSYVLLDPATYTLNISAGTITFEPNEGAKTIEITLNTIPLDLGQAHVLPFVIKGGSGGYGVNEGHDFILVQTLPINKYDGIYEVTGDNWTDVVVGTITQFYPYDWYAETTGANSVVFWDPYFETYYHPITSGADRSAYGSFGVEMEFDEVTGDILSITSPWAPAGNTRDVLYDANDGLNKWNESDGSIDAKYHMIQPSLVPAPPHIRTSFNEHMAYSGPR